jgi:hypothetical protein
MYPGPLKVKVWGGGEGSGIHLLCPSTVPYVYKSEAGFISEED